MFTLSSKPDYALLLISQLLDKSEYIPLSQLVKNTKLPKRFIARIASDLVKNGILKSREGKIGGYKLMKQLNKINLFDFLKIFEPEFHLVKCQDPKYKCEFIDMCNHNTPLKIKLTGIISKELTNWTLKDVYEKK